MSENPISIEVRINGVEPSDRFYKALTELGAAAAEFTEDVQGFSWDASGAADTARSALPEINCLELPLFKLQQHGARPTSLYVYTPEFKK